MLLKCCTQYVSKFGKRCGQGTEKSQFAFQSQRRAVPKNVQTTAQLHSYHMLARLCSKSFKLGLSSIWTKNFQMYNLGFWKGKGTWDHIANIHRIMEKASKFQKKHLLLFHWLCESLDCVDHNKLWKNLKEMRIPDHVCYLSPKKPVCGSKSNS